MDLLRTLHAYLLKDLLKVMLLTLVALTLLLSVLVIIQPLRKLGLAGEQLLELFVYTVPIMLSLTLPFATLFAAALIYGRFSQDNELLAARASGVATLSLLRPALGMGMVVTIVSLVLTNVVAPKLSTLSGLVQSNIRQIFFHKLASRGYFDYNRQRQRHVIHADFVDADANALHGVIYVVQTVPKKPAKKAKAAEAPSSPASPSGDVGSGADAPPGAAMAWAKWASLLFVRDPNGDHEVVIRAEEPKALAGGSIMGQRLGGSKVFEFAMPLPNPLKEKTSWYGWSDLLGFLRQPEKHPAIRRELTKVRQGLSAGMLGADIAETVGDGRSYERLTQGDEQFKIEAAWAEVGKSGAVLSSTKPDGREGKRVTVFVQRGGKTREMVTAQRGHVSLAWSRLTNAPQVTIRLESDVKVDFLGDPGGRRVSRPAFWARGEVPVPKGILAKANAVSLADLYENPAQLTSDEKVISSIKTLRDKRVPRLRSDLIAELHVRAAYGTSCFLMVAMGAALGLMFRGGQFISAFATSVIPAAGVIITLLMGKELIRNPANSDVLGMACIWGGIVLLGAANVAIYAYLARR